MSGAGLEVALETSSRTPSVAARFGGRLVECNLTAGRAHASDLLPCLAELLGKLGTGPESLAAVFVGSGPGSYTGLRVGMASALGLARGRAAQLFALPSLEVLAWDSLERGQAAAFLLDARQGEFYLARYAREEQDLRVLRAPCLVSAAELGGQLALGEALFADEAAERAGLPAELAPRRASAPRAAALLELAARRMSMEGAQSAAQLAPLYLRPFSARASRR